jgi:hypothetical protein
MPIKRLTAIFVKNVCARDAYSICLLTITSITVSEFFYNLSVKKYIYVTPTCCVQINMKMVKYFSNKSCAFTAVARNHENVGYAPLALRASIYGTCNAISHVKCFVLLH